MLIFDLSWWPYLDVSSLKSSVIVSTSSLGCSVCLLTHFLIPGSISWVQDKKLATLYRRFKKKKRNLNIRERYLVQKLNSEGRRRLGHECTHDPSKNFSPEETAEIEDQRGLPHPHSEGITMSTEKWIQLVAIFETDKIRQQIIFEKRTLVNDSGKQRLGLSRWRIRFFNLRLFFTLATLTMEKGQR